MDQLDRLRHKFAEITASASSGPTVEFDEERKTITLRPRDASYYLESLKTPDWTDISREDVRGWRIVIQGYLFDVDDEDVWKDRYCAEWFYRTYGYDNVSISYDKPCGRGGDMAVSNSAMMFAGEMWRKYGSDLD